MSTKAMAALTLMLLVACGGQGRYQPVLKERTTEIRANPGCQNGETGCAPTITVETSVYRAFDVQSGKLSD